MKQKNEIAFQNLIHEINDDLVVHKKVFRMTQLLEKYKGYLPADTGTSSQFNMRTSLIIILTQCALHQLVHMLTGCNFMYFKIFLECFILTNETKIPLNGFVLGACYNTCLWHSWNLFSIWSVLKFCSKYPHWTILYHVRLKLFTTVIAIENIQVNKTAVFSKQIR
jgi:hypothetical protein